MSFKKIIITCFVLVYIIPMYAQEKIQVQASKRTINRFYSNIYKSIVNKYYSALSQNRLVLYKDEKLQKTYSNFEDIKKVGQYKIKVNKEVYFEAEKVYKTVDTTEIKTFEESWIYGIKKVNPTLYCFYFKRPKDDASQIEIQGYINAGQLRSLLTDIEWNLIDEFTQGTKDVVTPQMIYKAKWKKFQSFGPELYNVGVSDRATVWENFEFKNKIKGAEIKDRFKLQMSVTIKPDSTIPEMNYDSFYTVPFSTDSLYGFGFIIYINNDITNGTISSKLYALSPLYDQTGHGGEAAFVDDMFWVKKEDLAQSLKPEDWKFINEIIYLAFSERLSCECFF